MLNRVCTAARHRYTTFIRTRARFIIIIDIGVSDCLIRNHAEKKCLRTTY